MKDKSKCGQGHLIKWAKTNISKEGRYKVYTRNYICVNCKRNFHRKDAKLTKEQ